MLDTILCSMGNIVVRDMSNLDANGIFGLLQEVIKLVLLEYDKCHQKGTVKALQWKEKE